MPKKNKVKTIPFKRAKNGKISREEFVGLFPPRVPGMPDKKMTQRGAVHKHKPTWLPPKANMSPAAWKRARRERRKQNA